MLDILRIKDFRNLWIGQAISRIGDAFYFLGPMFVIKKVFNDDAMVGAVGAVEALPYLLFGTIGGAIADRIDRKKIMIWSDLLSAVFLLVYLGFLMSVGSQLPKWIFFVVGFSLAFVRVFFFPAKNAAIPRLVPAEKLFSANALSAATDQFMWLIGNVLMVVLGMLADRIGVIQFLKVLVLVNAVTFLFSVYFLYLLPGIEILRSEHHEEKHLFTDVKEGIAYAKRDRVIGLSLLASFGLGLFMSPFFVVYLATNMAWFGNHASPLAFIETCFIIGMLSMSFIIPRLKVKKAGMAYGLGLTIAGICVLFMGFSPIYGMYCLWNLVCGFAIGGVDVPMRTYQMLKVPDEYRGRIMSLGQLIWMSVQPIGMSLGGPLLGWLGIVKMHVLMGAGFATTGAAPLLDKEFREATIPDQPSPSEDVEFVPTNLSEYPLGALETETEPV
ncbi:MAG: MFS transporter [Armatimonadetes bacterium]|nr:MFS transporter [Armatimonadota bacterium]MBS1700028.1 MFS transporter [Armatimonadota bacterium]